MNKIGPLLILPIAILIALLWHHPTKQENAQIENIISKHLLALVFEGDSMTIVLNELVDTTAPPAPDSLRFRAARTPRVYAMAPPKKDSIDLLPLRQRLELGDPRPELRPLDSTITVRTYSTKTFHRDDSAGIYHYFDTVPQLAHPTIAPPDPRIGLLSMSEIAKRDSMLAYRLNGIIAPLDEPFFPLFNKNYQALLGYRAAERGYITDEIRNGLQLNGVHQMHWRLGWYNVGDEKSLSFDWIVNAVGHIALFRKNGAWHLRDSYFKQDFSLRDSAATRAFLDTLYDEIALWHERKERKHLYACVVQESENPITVGDIVELSPLLRKLPCNYRYLDLPATSALHGGRYDSLFAHIQTLKAEGEMREATDSLRKAAWKRSGRDRFKVRRKIARAIRLHKSRKEKRDDTTIAITTLSALITPKGRATEIHITTTPASPALTDSIAQAIAAIDFGAAADSVTYRIPSGPR